MSMPPFYDVDPPPACGCEACARQRLADSTARRAQGRPGRSAGGYTGPEAWRRLFS